MREEDSICVFTFGENYGVAGVEAGKQQSPGLLHLDWFESSSLRNEKQPPFGDCFSFLVAGGGLEPPGYEEMRLLVFEFLFQ